MSIEVAKQLQVHEAAIAGRAGPHRRKRNRRAGVRHQIRPARRARRSTKRWPSRQGSGRLPRRHLFKLISNQIKRPGGSKQRGRWRAVQHERANQRGFGAQGTENARKQRRKLHSKQKNVRTSKRATLSAPGRAIPEQWRLQRSRRISAPRPGRTTPVALRPTSDDQLHRTYSGLHGQHHLLVATMDRS